MDFSLSDEQTMFRDMFRDFAEKEVAKAAEHTDRSEDPPRNLLRMAAGQGFFGAPIPEEYGGVGIDWLSYTMLVEELGRHCLSTAVTVALHTSLAAMTILDAGTEEQKRRLLPPLAAGEEIGAFALTEPDAGTDAGSIRARAAKVEGGYRLDGIKTWVGNGGVADVFVTFARTAPAERHRGLTAFVVRREAPGLTVGYREKTLGLRGLDIRTLYLEDCFVPRSDVLGDENGAWAVILRAFSRARLSLAAIALGAAEASLSAGVTFAAERKQFGAEIAHKQAMQNYVADVATDIEALRGLVRHAAWLADRGHDFGRAASMAKYFGARVAKDAANKMLQVHGGYGFSDEYAISRLYRDVRALRIVGGTDEIQRYVVARGAFEEKGITIQP